MVSNLHPEGRQNWDDNVFHGLLVGQEEPSLVSAYLAGHDFSEHTRRAIRNDLRKFAHWFSQANREPFTVKRVTLRDVTDFRNHLHRDRRQAVASVNRALVTIRRFFDWLAREGHVEANPAKAVKELRRQPLAPKGLERADVRRLLREIELRHDVRAGAIFSLLLFTGCRVSDLVNLEMTDVLVNERSGSVVFRHGKGGKQRTVPLPLPARKALQAYLDTRPSVASTKVFVGERGPMTDCGIRAMCRKYSAVIGVRLHPHVFRHTMAKQFLADNANDLVSLAQILGHENLNTTSRYSQRGQEQLADAAERLSF
jgi:site-specific recombinase XerD